ncbi:hypothetical protein POM88_030688 [Heracleum sosnowskyi]|uniref:Uncharacterized protein n=1 Tax=Heracleum sosnowskyi TaxID=360622 RepID=A0AAD8HWE3_9APIA|nr:hypothetical protein POM88_030688 [Heracleum sosnowskyi]
MCKIHVFHSWSTVDPPNVEEEGENKNVVENEIVEEESDPSVNLDDNESLVDMFEKLGEAKKYTARKRVLNAKGTDKGKKKINVDSGIDDNGDESWYDNEDESANESSDMGDLNDNYSDEEFADMRTIREEIRKEHDQLFNEQSHFIKDSLVGYKNTDEGMFNDNNSTDNLYGDKIRRNPNWKLSEMKKEFKRVLKVEVFDAKCCRVRKRALSGVEEEIKKHYSGLRRFGGEILRGNKENTVKICTTRVNEGDAPHFQRMYVCYA